jgi:hypothetical protein
VVAITLTSTIVLLIAMVYTGITNTWFAIEDRLDLNQDTRRAMNHIVQEVRMAKSVTVAAAGKVDLVSLENEPISYELNRGEIFRNDKSLASAVSGFEVELEAKDVLRVKIQAEQGDQSYVLEQRIKLRNKGSQG